MAKDKVEKAKPEPAGSFLDDALADVRPPEFVKPPTAAETATALAERVKVLEDAVAAWMPDLHAAARFLQKSGAVAVGRRVNDYYKDARTLLGGRGDEIDGKLRG